MLVKKSWNPTRNPLFPQQRIELKNAYMYLKNTRAYGETLNKQYNHTFHEN